MKDITDHFGTLYHPVSALVIYQTKDDDKDTYVEHFDMDKDGNPINAHPLSEREAKIFAKSLNTEKEKSKAFLKPESILPTHVLYINPTEKGSVIWYTKAKKVKLFFTESLEISNGIAHTPPMLWMASKQHLTVFALTSDKRPTEKTVLYHAPFLMFMKTEVSVWEQLVWILKIQHRLRNLSVLGKAIFLTAGSAI